MRKGFGRFCLIVFIQLCIANLFISCNEQEFGYRQEQENFSQKTNALQNELDDLKTSLESTLEDIRTWYQVEIEKTNNELLAAKKKIEEASANGTSTDTVNELQKTVAELNKKLKSLDADLFAASVALQCQIDQCNSAIEEITKALNSHVDKKEFAAFTTDAAAKYAALTGNYETLVDNLNKLSEETNISIVQILLELSNLQKKQDEDYSKLLKNIAEGKGENDNSISKEEAARIAAIKDLQAQIDALKTWNEETANVKAENIQSNVTTLKNRISENEISIEELTTEMAKINNNIQSLQSQINTLAVLIEKNITSLVHKPSKYLNGIGIIDAQSFTGCHTMKEVNVAYNGSQVLEYTPATTYSTWASPAHAFYHVNPTTADISKYNFTFDDVETENILTRANDTKSIGATVSEVTEKFGILDVKFQITSPQNLNDAGLTTTESSECSSWVSTLALQAKKKEAEKVANNVSIAAGTVTSNYAVIVPVYYGNLILANKKAEPAHQTINNRSNHLRTSAVETIKDSEETFILPYNSELNIAQYIETHYGTSKTAMGEKIGDKAFTEEEFQASGMKYVYQLVQYKSNKYSDHSNLATIDANTGIVKVKNPHAKYIGDTFVVRILLQDGNGKTLSVGYVKVLIADLGPIIAEINNGIVLNCVDPTKLDGTLSSIINQYQPNYNDLLTTNDFRGSKYVLDTKLYISTGINAQSIDNNAISLENNNRIVLSLNENITREWFYPNNFVVPQNVIVYARFKQLQPGYSDLWVAFNVTKEKIVYAKGTFLEADKIKTYWFKKNSREAATTGNYDEVHANPAVPETGASEPTFDFNMLSTFVGAKAKINGLNAALTTFTADPYADLNIAPSSFNNRIVSGTSGTKYQLKVMNNKTLVAYKQNESSSNAQKVIVLENDVNNYQGIACFQKTEYAKDILNYASHNEMEENKTFCVEIQMTQNRNCYNVELTNNTFLAKFVRPVSIIDQNAHMTVDAEHGGGYWYAQDMVKFYDWRDYAFDTHTSFYDFYKVGQHAIKPDFAKATTDINGGNDLLQQVAPNVNLAWIEDATNPGANNFIHGKITYANNGAIVNSTFHIHVPISINYFWGTFHSTVTLTVDPTAGN